MPTKMNAKFTKIRRSGAFAARVGATAALGGAATGIGAGVPGANDEPAVLRAKTTLERSVEASSSRRHYRRVYDEAKRLDVEPKRNLAEGVARTPELRAGAAALSVEVTGEKATRKVKEADEPAAEPGGSAYGTPESVGVDQSTLDAIAACESGGDPTAVDPSGTYRGKYQFDLGTWASVGGSGDPAAAPEAEQDYRAALLMSQAGSSPWPVCGS